MQMLTIVWHPNAAWEALDDSAKLDDYITQGRAAGAVVSGWCEIDHSLPTAPVEGSISVFGLDSAEQVHGSEKVVSEARWHEYFGSTDISINLSGMTEAEPHCLYARMLGVPFLKFSY